MSKIPKTSGEKIDMCTTKNTLNKKEMELVKTDKILPEVNEWQNRPLDRIYPVIYYDGCDVQAA